MTWQMKMKMKMKNEDDEEIDRVSYDHHLNAFHHVCMIPKRV